MREAEMSMTESDALEILTRDDEEMRKGFFCINDFFAIEVAKKALEEIQQYRAIGTVSEFRENKNFLEFLYNTILPNEMEQYLAMYHASEEKGE